MATIELKNIAKKFGSYQALHDINLSIADQEFMVLLGASGCGKTTMLRIIAGLETADNGGVWIGDKRIDHLPPRRRGIAMVFQNYAVFPHLKVFDNIGFGLKMHKVPREEIQQRVHQTAALLHIDQLLGRYSGELSGGQRQRVAVARALAMKPDVILMDEPLSNLDALLRLDMRAELKSVLAESKTTTIYVTHDQVEAMSLADHISVMDSGKIVQAAAPIDVYRNPSTTFVAGFIGNPPMNFLSASNLGNGDWNVAGHELKGPKSDQQSLDFAIRPEDLSIAKTGFTIEANVVEPLGAHLLVTCFIEGKLFRVILESDVKLSPGENIVVSPNQDRIRWFDQQTKQAVSNT